jgi:putative transposase
MASAWRSEAGNVTLVWTNRQRIEAEGKQSKKAVVMPARKRKRRERTHDWQEIQQQTLWPEQTAYELLCPIVLFGETAAERAKETGASERTLHYQADQFERYGMVSLFRQPRSPSPEPGRSLPPQMCQLIVNLKSEYPGFSFHEISTICFVRFGRKLSHHTVQRVLADGPKPQVSGRRYPPYAETPDPYQRRRAIVDLHAEGWSNTAISAYLQTSRPTIYATLERWTEEGVSGLEAKSKARKGPRKVTLNVTNEIRKLQDNPLLGKFRVHTALLRMGIEVSPATCARIMAANRQLYGLEKPKREGRAKLEMPFKATRRHEYWSADIRYIEEHLLPDPKPVYVITIFENFSGGVTRN